MLTELQNAGNVWEKDASIYSYTRLDALPS